MIDLELWKSVDESKAPKEAITHEMFSEMIMAIEEVKIIMEDWSGLSGRIHHEDDMEQWLDKYFGGVK